MDGLGEVLQGRKTITCTRSRVLFLFAGHSSALTSAWLRTSINFGRWASTLPIDEGSFLELRQLWPEVGRHRQVWPKSGRMCQVEPIRPDLAEFENSAGRARLNIGQQRSSCATILLEAYLVCLVKPPGRSRRGLRNPKYLLQAARHFSLSLANPVKGSPEIETRLGRGLPTLTSMANVGELGHLVGQSGGAFGTRSTLPNVGPTSVKMRLCAATRETRAPRPPPCQTQIAGLLLERHRVSPHVFFFWNSIVQAHRGKCRSFRIS